MAVTHPQADPGDVIDADLNASRVFYDVEDAPSESVLPLTRHPDLDQFEEVQVPARLDQVFQRPGIRAPGPDRWGDNHWGVEVHRTVGEAVHDAGLRDDVTVTDLGGEAVVATRDPGDVPRVLRAVARRGLLGWPAGPLEVRVAAPRWGVVRKEKDGYHVRSKKGKNLGGPYTSRGEAEKRLRQVEFFKHRKAAPAGPRVATREDRLREVARGIRHVGDYGRGWWDETTRTVHWTMADGDGGNDTDTSLEIEAAFLRVPGVQEVELGDEWDPPRGSGYVRFWPEETKETKTAGAPVTMTLPMTSADPTKPLSRQLGGVGQVQPGPSPGTTTLQTTNPKQALTTMNQLLDQGKITMAPATNTTTTTPTPTSPTTQVAGRIRSAARIARALRVAQDRYRAEPWFRGVLGGSDHVRVRVACGCGEYRLPPRDQAAGVPVRFVILLPGHEWEPEDNPPPGDPGEPGEAPRVTAEAPRVAGRVAGPTQKELFKSRAPGAPGAPGPGKPLDLPEPPPDYKTPRWVTEGTDRGLWPSTQLMVDESYQRKYRRAWQKWQAAEARFDADPYAAQEARRDAEQAYTAWQNHLRTIKHGPKRDRRWKTIPGITRAAQEFLEKMGGREQYVNWYDRHRAWIEQRFGPDREWGGGPDLFYRFLAATSPNNAVESNVTMAWRAYQEFRNAKRSGSPVTFENYIRSHKLNLYRAAEGEELSGPKVNPFDQNLRGVEGAPAVVDLWMGRLLFGEDKPTPKQIAYAQEVIQKIADSQGWGISYTQGLLWEMIRDRWGHAPADFLASLERILGGDQYGDLFEPEGGTKPAWKPVRPRGPRRKQSARARQASPGTPGEVALALLRMLREDDPEGPDPGPPGTPTEAPKTAAAHRAPETLRTLPRRPDQVLGVGDWVAVDDGDASPEGFVDRVSPTHVYVRAWPTFRHHVTTPLDWRERAHWRSLKVRKQGERTPRVWRAASAGFLGMGRDDSLWGLDAFHEAADEAARRAKRRQEAARSQPTREASPAPPGATEVVPVPEDPEARVQALEDHLHDLTFGTNHLPREAAWAEIRGALRRQWPGLDPNDLQWLKGRWQRLRRKTAGRLRPAQAG
jgi:hypothetical protein